MTLIIKKITMKCILKELIKQVMRKCCKNTFVKYINHHKTGLMGFLGLVKDFWCRLKISPKSDKLSSNFILSDRIKFIIEFWKDLFFKRTQFFSFSFWKINLFINTLPEFRSNPETCNSELLRLFERIINSHKNGHVYIIGCKSRCSFI